MDKGKYNAHIESEKFSHLFAVFWPGSLIFLNCFRVEEVSVYLAVQIFPISYNDECKIAGKFAEKLSDKKYHGKAFACPLSMPENAKLSVFSLPLPERLNSSIDTNKLVVLGDNFYCLFVVEDEVFHIIKQFVLGAEALNGPFNTGSFTLYLFSVDLFFFILYTQPVKKVSPS